MTADSIVRARNSSRKAVERLIREGNFVTADSHARKRESPTYPQMHNRHPQPVARANISQSKQPIDSKGFIPVENNQFHVFVGTIAVNLSAFRQEAAKGPLGRND